MELLYIAIGFLIVFAIVVFFMIKSPSRTEPLKLEAQEVRRKNKEVYQRARAALNDEVKLHD